MNFRDLTPYYRVILLGYIIALPFLLFFSSGKVSYDITWHNVVLTLGVFVISVIIFLLLAPILKLGHVTFRRLTLNQILFTFLYGVVIALPEEIFFRGLIQGSLQYRITGAFLPILIASCIFGAAHLPNGAKGWRIRRWNWDFFLLAFVGGIPLGATFYLTGEVLSPALLHTLFLFSLRSFRKPMRT